MIGPTDLEGIDEGLALRVLGFARTIAPRLDELVDGDRDTAIAVLLAIAREVAARGSRFIAGQRIGPAAIDYRDVQTFFGSDDRATLRALAGPILDAGLPAGHFPRPGVVSRMWPETY